MTDVLAILETAGTVWQRAAQKFGQPDALRERKMVQLREYCTILDWISNLEKLVRRVFLAIALQFYSGAVTGDPKPRRRRRLGGIAARTNPDHIPFVRMLSFSSQRPRPKRPARDPFAWAPAPPAEDDWLPVHSLARRFAAIRRTLDNVDAVARRLKQRIIAHEQLQFRLKRWLKDPFRLTEGQRPVHVAMMDLERVLSWYEPPNPMLRRLEPG